MKMLNKVKKALLYPVLFLCLGCGDGTEKGDIPKLNCETIADAPPRGVSLLHLSHTNARPQVERITGVMESLCIRRLALASLVDGSFGLDVPYIESVVTRLSANHELHLFLYLYNGSSQRRWKNSAIQGLFTTIEPGEFRKRIKKDASLQRQYRDMALSILDLTKNAQALGARVYWTFGLEDNLDMEGIRVLEGILRGYMPQGVTLVRNPCPGCYPGNSRDYGAYMGEHHGDGLNFSSASMVISNDGYRDDFQQLRSVRDKAAGLGSIFLYWNKAWQGLDGRGYIAAGERNYKVPSLDEERELKNFLEGK